MAAMPLAAAVILMGGGSDAHASGPRQTLAHRPPCMVNTPHLNKKKRVTLNWVVQRLRLICFTCSCSA